MAGRIRLISAPREDRHGRRSVPLSGGAALLAGLALPALLFPGESSWGHRLVLVGLGAFGIGLWDDVREMRPLVKGLLTALLAVLAPVVLDVDSATTFPLLSLSCWVFLHAFNIIDNMDGLALGTGLLAFLGLALISGSGSAWAAAGATVGVLVWNLPPARLFLGDSGSLLLGAWSWGSGVGVGLKITGMGGRPELLLLLWTLPLLDFVFVTAARILSGRRPWTGGRDHLSHRLARRLGSSRRALLVWMLLQLVLVILALILRRN
jgi:UDP-GlcNAc:undecaprenyl-phosphate GlcNAc-1-phosphate transferase